MTTMVRIFHVSVVSLLDGVLSHGQQCSCVGVVVVVHSVTVVGPAALTRAMVSCWTYSGSGAEVSEMLSLCLVK